jgi:hypothetical protein
MYTKALSLLALVGAAQAHMSLWYPGPLGGAKEANKASTEVDAELNFPLGCCDNEGKPTAPSPGVCRGHLDLFDAEDAQVTWQAGGDAYFQLSDHTYTDGAAGSTHYGGSCQVGFSTDRGETWKVAASYNGNCPLRGDDGSPDVQTFDFKVPTGMPEGKALFAWIWLNREHESFMNCAAVQIGEGSGNSTTPTTPTNPPKPSSSATKPTPPNQSAPASAPAPSKPDGDKPSYGTPPSQPQDNDDSEAPSNDDESSNDDDEEEEPSWNDSEEPEWSENNDWNQDDESNEDNNDDESNEAENKYTPAHPGRWSPRPRTYMVDGLKCKCSSSDVRLCPCTGGSSSLAERGIAGRKALRQHRREASRKRANACDWNSAPSMIVSYYTVDAACAANAKMNNPESDEFEIGWEEPCGVVEGDGQYPVKTMECSMFG